jgi:benzodiazapine receptor
METSSIIAIILFPLLSLILGSLGAIITAKQIPIWYEHLKKPKLNPPKWIFGPVWTVLYILIGFSGWFIWDLNKGFSGDHVAAWFFYFCGFLLNLLWTPLFFGLHWLLTAFIEIVVLDVFILINIILFWQIKVVAGAILIPYFLWVTFASYLSGSNWYLNRNGDGEVKKDYIKSSS